MHFLNVYRIKKVFGSALLIPIMLIFFGTFLYTFNISGQGTALDEAETAVVARGIFIYGVPASWDGRNIIPVSEGLEFKIINDIYVWRWHPWMHHYLYIIGEIIFGNNILLGRLPFAFLGALTSVVLYLIANLIFRNRWVALLVALHLLLLVPFFLYSRQIRYYAPNALFGLISFYYLLVLYQNHWKKKMRFPFFMTHILLFFTNYITWGTTALLTGLIGIYKRKSDIILILFLVGLVAIVWYIVLRPFEGNVFFQSEFNGYLLKLIGVLSYLNNYIFPFILIPPLFLFKKRSLVYFLLIVIGVKIMLYEIFYFKHGRYLIDTFPLFILLYGFYYKYLIQKKKYFFVVMLFFVTCFTNLFNTTLASVIKQEIPKIEFWPRIFSIELLNKYESVLMPVSRYLQKNYKNGDLFLATGLPWDIYAYSNVPSFYSSCDSDIRKIIPKEVRNVDKIRWIIFINTPADKKWVSGATCNALNNFYEKFEKVKLREEDTYSINDPDIANRNFPPYRASPNHYIMVYERK